jgi:hypothetical protein
MKNKRHSVLVEEAKEYFIRSQYLFEYIHTKSETKGKIVSNKMSVSKRFHVLKQISF